VHGDQEEKPTAKKGMGWEGGEVLRWSTNAQGTLKGGEKAVSKVKKPYEKGGS